MKMHCELLSSKFPEESTTASVSDLIKNMVDGKATHRAGALKLALRNRPSAVLVLVPPVVVNSGSWVYYS
jgi:hypothetical protein